MFDIAITDPTVTFRDEDTCQIGLTATASDKKIVIGVQSFSTSVLVREMDLKRIAYDFLQDIARWNKCLQRQEEVKAKLTDLLAEIGKGDGISIEAVR